jgi:seryl-tRNA(Sec) selenium transferase
VIVDAAVEVYPLSHMTQWIERGAAVQVMAMKYINAPQSTGVAVGSADFISHMKLHTFQAYETPHFGDEAFGAHEGEFVEFNNAWHVRGIGRTHKVTRSDIMGCVAALDSWWTLDHAARLAEAHGKCERLCAELESVAGVSTTIDEDNTESYVSHPQPVAPFSTRSVHCCSSMRVACLMKAA